MTLSKRRVLRRALFIVAALVLVAQAVPVERTNPAVEAAVQAPAEVAGLLRRACYDCHSRETQWPWYSRVAPVSWLVVHDVDEGRAELDFSAWESYATSAKRKKLRETAEEVAEGEMPPWYYLLLHPEARLGDGEKQMLRDWVTGETARLGR